MKHNVPIQSLIDHIKTAIDVDPWAKEMAEELLSKLDEKKNTKVKVEFIESYIKLGDSDYKWNDNHGELIRCKYCKHRDPEDHKCDCGHDIQWQLPREDNWFCADGERKQQNA